MRAHHCRIDRFQPNPAFSTMKRTTLYYFFVVSAVGLGIFFILRAGNQFPAPALPLSTQSSSQITPHLTGVGDYSFPAAVESSLWDNALKRHFQPASDQRSASSEECRRGGAGNPGCCGRVAGPSLLE